MRVLALFLTSTALPLAARCFRLEQPGGFPAAAESSWRDRRYAGASHSESDDALSPGLSLESKVPDVDAYRRLWTARYLGEHHLTEPLPSSVKLILGVFTIAQETAYRQVVRETWMNQTGVCYWTVGRRRDCSVYTAFVIGKSGAGFGANASKISSEAMAKVHAEEGMLVLDLVENMNLGKSLVWFNTALRMFPWATHIGKMDMDTYPFLHKLVHRMGLNRSCVRQVTPYEFIGRAKFSKDVARFNRSCPFRPCFGRYMSRLDSIWGLPPKHDEWCFMAGELYIMSQPLVGKLLPPSKPDGRHEDQYVSEHVSRSAEEQHFCVAVRRLDSWFHKNSLVDAAYGNSF